jgi:hypothetical protein
MFRSMTIITELVLSLAKVILKHSVKIRRYTLCGGVAAFHRAECVLCVVQNATESPQLALTLDLATTTCFVLTKVTTFKPVSFIHSTIRALLHCIYMCYPYLFTFSDILSTL